MSNNWCDFLIYLTLAVMGAIAFVNEFPDKKILNFLKNPIVKILIIFALGALNTFATRSKDANAKNESDTAQEKLNAKVDSLKRANDTLSSRVSKSALDQAHLITQSQTRSAQDLKNAASTLNNSIYGSQKVPYFYFTIMSDTLLSGTIRNTDSLAVFNISGKICNYDNLLNCKKRKENGKVTIYDMKCLAENTTYIPFTQSLNANTAIDYDLPHYRMKRKARYVAWIYMKNKMYYEEAIYIIENNNISEGLRISEVNPEGKPHFKIIHDIRHFKLKNVDWDKEFPLPILTKYLNM